MWLNRDFYGFPFGVGTTLRRAFTLIELLVVVAIIVVLISILLPSLGRAKRQAQAAVCASNLKQFGNGFSIYLNENDNWFPTRHWNTCIDPILNPNQKVPTGWAPLTNSIFRCPTAPLVAGGHAMNLSYGYTGVWWDTSSQDYPFFADSSNPNRSIRATQVQSPYAKCVINECWNTDYDALWGSNLLNDQKVKSVHNQSANFLLADFHVERIKVPGIPDYLDIQWHMDPIYLAKSEKITKRF